jgi:hypothetical protein
MYVFCIYSCRPSCIILYLYIIDRNDPEIKPIIADVITKNVTLRIKCINEMGSEAT